MKIFKLKLKSRDRASVLDDWNEPLFVVAADLLQVCEKHKDIYHVEVISENAEIIPDLPGKVE